MNPINLRLINQQLISPQFSLPEEVVSYFGAMQGQEYRMMRWAVGMRTKKPSLSEFHKSYNNGRIVRMHLLRGTWQLISGDDYWWMLELCGAKAESVIRGWMSSNKISLPEDELFKVRGLIGRIVSEKGSATKEDIRLGLLEKDMSMADQRLSYHIRLSELCGLLCSGDIHKLKPTYSISEEKLGSRNRISKDEALYLLTKKYFQSHQPATLEDYHWWSGLNVSDCRRGIELMGTELRTETLKDRTFYLTDSCRCRGFRRDRYILLPSYDEYLIGYKSRDIVLAPEYRHHAHNNSGIFKPVIAHDGIICGNWKIDQNSIETSFFLEGHDFKKRSDIVAPSSHFISL